MELDLNSLDRLPELMGDLHDRWFSIDSVAFDAQREVVTIPFSLYETRPKTPPDKILTISSAQGVEVRDPERIQMYTLNELLIDTDRMTITLDADPFAAVIVAVRPTFTVSYVDVDTAHAELSRQDREAESSNAPRVILPAAIAAAFLVLALAPWPRFYFLLLRVVVCVAGAFLAYAGYALDRKWAVWVFGLVALLFNPLFPVPLTGEVSVAVAALFVIAAIVLGSQAHTRKEP